MKKKPVFPKRYCARMESDSGEVYPLFIGTPDRLSELDADDGDAVAIYRLEKIVTFRTNARLE